MNRLEPHRRALVVAVVVAMFVLAVLGSVGDGTTCEAGPVRLPSALAANASDVDLQAPAPDPVLAASDPSALARRPVEPVVAARPAVVAPRTSRPASARAIGWNEPVGRLAVRAVDATASDRVVPAPTVRAVSATRFAERPGVRAGETFLKLTPDTYALHVASRGYEPVEVPSVCVRATEWTTLPPIRLQPGSGRIAGRALGARPGDVLQAELRGDGRLSCGECAGKPCKRCGYALDHSRAPLGPAGEFAFDRLASGVYVLRVVDEGGREAARPVRVDLGVAQSARVDLPVDRVRSVLVALEDVDGRRLDEVWAARGGAHATDSGAVSTGGRRVHLAPWSCDFREGDDLVASGEFVSPAPSGVVFRWSRGRGCSSGRSILRDDRERRPDDELRPTPVVPYERPAQLAPFVEADGTIRIDDVPARAERLELSCDGFVASVRIAGDARGPIRVRLGRDPEWTEGAATWLALEAGGGD